MLNILKSVGTAMLALTSERSLAVERYLNESCLWFAQQLFIKDCTVNAKAWVRIPPLRLKNYERRKHGGKIKTLQDGVQAQGDCIP